MIRSVSIILNKTPAIDGTQSNMHQSRGQNGHKLQLSDPAAHTTSSAINIDAPRPSIRPTNLQTNLCRDLSPLPQSEVNNGNEYGVCGPSPPSKVCPGYDSVQLSRTPSCDWCATAPRYPRVERTEHKSSSVPACKKGQRTLHLPCNTTPLASRSRPRPRHDRIYNSVKTTTHTHSRNDGDQGGNGIYTCFARSARTARHRAPLGTPSTTTPQRNATQRSAEEARRGQDQDRTGKDTASETRRTKLTYYNSSTVPPPSHLAADTNKTETSYSLLVSLPPTDGRDRRWHTNANRSR